MIKIKQVEEVEELLKVWRRLWEVTKREAPRTTPEHFLQLVLTCYTTGAVFLVWESGSLRGLCCLEESLPSTLILRVIPNDKGTGVARECIKHIREWGRNLGYKLLEVSSENLNGSSFRYFEKTLGFRRRYVTFTSEI